MRATPGAYELLVLCAFLAPDHIPRAMLSEHAEELPELLREILSQPLAYNQALGALGRYSLVTTTKDNLTVHRLVQTVVRASLTSEDQRWWAGAAACLVDSAFPRPRGSNDEATMLVLPHARSVLHHVYSLAVKHGMLWLEALEHGMWSELSKDMVLYLFERGVTVLRRKRGDDAETLTMMHDLAKLQADVGDLDRAREMFEQALAGRQRLLGDDHDDTLKSMNDLAEVRRKLGEL